MKKIIFTLAHLLIFTSLIAQQNAIWSLPPNYIKFTGPGGNPSTPIPLPKPTVDPFSVPITPNTDPYDGYDGQISNFNHNAMQDANGDLLFFVVDGFVYDYDGYFIGEMTKNSNLGYRLQGYVETSIIPVPGSCTRYYIIGTRFGNIWSQGGHLTNIVEYAIVDMSVKSFETGSQGALISLNPLNLPPPYDQSAFDANVFDLSNAVPSPPHFNAEGESQVKISMATSELRSDNTRFLYVMGEQCIARFKVTSSGITYDNYEFVLLTPNAPFSADRAVRSEMELIKTPTGYRIACSYPSAPAYQDIVLLVGEIDNNGDITSYNVIGLPSDNLNNDSPIKGIEFSPNGNYIYITHVPNNINPLPFKIYEVATNNFIPLTNNPSMQSQVAAFKNSQIELGKDGKLYLANTTSLATIGNSNSPGVDGSGLIWNNSALSILYNLNQLGHPTNSENMKLYILPDQVDGMDYSAYYTEVSTECCVANTTYSTTTYPKEQSGTQSWTTSSNPFGNTNTITVKDELIIKTGANITATGLRFEFAPDAKLVIEQGARFTANSCTFTVNTECENSPMWNGIEVHGPSANKQWYDAGRFIANSSTIEHSYLGAHNFATVKSGTPGVFWEDYTFKRGGVIQATNTTFKNNHRGTVFFGFENRSILNLPINDESKFDNCIFQTSAQLNKPSLTPTVIMAHLFDVQGVNFYGCDFKNTASYAAIPYIDRGMGISANNCLITVTKKCNVVNCTNPDKGNFINLLRGIESIATSTKTTEVSYTNFYNNWRSIYLEEVDLAKIIENYVNVGADSYWGSSYGLYLNTCDGYTVENNTFNTNTTTQNGYVGVYVLNSGTENNEIYRNTFDKFYVGSQAVDVNGNGVFGSGSKGLEFRCNTYINGRDHDILISSGSINQTHGTCLNATSPSNNRFSYTTQYGDFWHVDLTKHISYQFSQPNGYNLAPRNYPIATHYNDVNTFPTICGSYNFNPSTSCPDRINTGGGSSSMSFGGSSTNLMSEMEANQVVIEDLEEELAQMNTNDTTAIKEKKETIAYFKNQKEKAKNNLLQHYLLSEDVENRFEEMLPIIEKEANPHKKMRFYLAAKKFDKAQELLDKVANKKTFGSFIKLYSSLLALEQSANFDEELRTNATLLQKITELADATDDSYEKSFAKTILKRAGLRNDLETIEMINLSSARLMNQEEIATSNSKLQTSNSITVYPNPTSGEVNITHNLNLENGKVNFKVYNMLGVEVLNENLTSTNNEVKINNLKSGVYFYTITQNNQTIKTDKLMVK